MSAKKTMKALKWWMMCFVAFVLINTAFADDSWQVWLDQSASDALSEKSSIRAGQSFHYSCEDGRLATYYLEAGCEYSLLHWLDLGLAYRQQYDKRNGRWLEENRPYVDVIPRWKGQYVTLSDRSRIEHRHREEQDDTYRYRNKVTMQCNVWDKAFGLKPYVAAEAFVDESGNLKERDQTRFTLGLRTDPEKRRRLRARRIREGHALTMDYYVTEQRTKKADEWANEYIAGIQIGLHF